MKKLFSTLLFVFSVLTLVAQDGSVTVSFKGAAPTITDFAWAYLFAGDDDGKKEYTGIKQALTRYRKGLKQGSGVTLTVDEKNGYILYEYSFASVTDRIEMCCWNVDDGKHKLFAFNDMSLSYKGQVIHTKNGGLRFCRYINASKKMFMCDSPGFKLDKNSTYTLPRKGKDIIVTKPDRAGKNQKKTLKWNGWHFSF